MDGDVPLIARPVGRITDKPVLEATSNGDGTHSGVKLVQWLYEATTGKALPEDEARALVKRAQAEGRARIERRQQERRDV